VKITGAGTVGTEGELGDDLVFDLPGLSISPAETATASVRLRIVAAHIWRKDFIWLLLIWDTKIL